MLRIFGEDGIFLYPVGSVIIYIFHWVEIEPITFVISLLFGLRQAYGMVPIGPLFSGDCIMAVSYYWKNIG